MGRVPTDGSRSGLRMATLFTDGSNEVVSVEASVTRSPGLWTGGTGSAASTTGAAEVTLSQAKKLRDAPKRVWRRETLHTLEGRASSCPNTLMRGTQPGDGLRARHPPRNARDAGTRYGSHGWQTLVVFISAHGPSKRLGGKGKSGGSQPEGSVGAPWTVPARGETVKG
jgi:hypothetical protein